MNKNGLGFILLLLPVFIMASFGISVYNDSTSFDTPRQTVHKIFVGESYCSGVAVAADQVLTAFHCTGDPKLWGDNKPVIKVEGKEAKVIKVNERADLALLEVNVGCPCASLAAESPWKDDRVIAVGWPLGLAEVVTEGRSQWLIQDEDNSETYTLLSTTSIVFGNSGGGLFRFNWLSARWELVGITTKVPGANLGFFSIPVFNLTSSTPIEAIRDFLHR